jgi:hypothetical protein
MSEDSSFNKNKPQMNADERRCGVDLCGSVGKGMLAKEKIETLGNSSGLTPIGFGVNVRSYGVRTSSLLHFSDQYAENTEMLGNSPGLTTLHPFDEIYSTKKKSVSLIEGFSDNESLETLRNSSGLSPLNFDIKPQINADERRCSPLRTQSPVIKKIVYKGE